MNDAAIEQKDYSTETAQLLSLFDELSSKGTGTGGRSHAAKITTKALADAFKGSNSQHGGQRPQKNGGRMSRFGSWRE